MAEPKPVIQKETNDGNISEDDEFLNQIYNGNIDKINKYSKIIQITELIAFFSFLLLLILLCIKFSNLGNFSYFLLLFPASISIISTLIMMNTIFEIQDLIERTQSELQKNSNEKGSGSITMKVLLYFLGICLFAFSIVLFLRLENYISSAIDVNLIFIPFYLAILCSLAFAVFISPGFFKGELYFEIALIFIHIVSTVTFTFLLCYKINSPNSMKYAHVFVPYYFSIGSQLIYSIGKSFLDKNEFSSTGIKHLCDSLAVACILSAGIIIQVFLDGGKMKNFYYIPIILYIAAYLGLTIPAIVNIFKETTEDEEEDNMNEDDNGIIRQDIENGNPQLH